MVSKVHPALDQEVPSFQPTILKTNSDGIHLESLKYGIKLKRPKSTENLTFRDRNKIDLKPYVAPRSIDSRNGKQDYNARPLYFETLNAMKKEGL